VSAYTLAYGMPILAEVPPPRDLSRFTGWPLTVEFIDGRRWRVHRDISYRTGAGEVSTVRAGFVFDFASIPKVLWPLVPPAGDGHNLYGLAAVWHDWLYKRRKIGGRTITRREADALFLEIMLYVGVRPWLARAMYRAVRLMGGLISRNVW
jgi:hypothetical protein